MLENLVPVSVNHSVNRAVITLYLPQEILKPEKILDKINKEVHFTEKYKRRSTIKSKVFKISNEKNQFAVINKNLNDDVIGLILEQFDNNGKLENVIVLRNDESKSIMTFETRNYIRWINFFKRFIEDFSEITKESDFYFEAISLTYIDEFIWNEDSLIPVNDIFEENSELINSKFLKSKNGTIVLFSQKEDLNIEEKTEVSFNNDLKRVQIIHQHVTKFTDFYDVSKLLKNNKIKEILDTAHSSNKDTLEDLLKKEIKQKINLN